MSLKKIKKLFKKDELEVFKRFRNKESLLITYSQLEEAPLNETIQINPDCHGAIECTRLTSNSPDALIFSVSMRKGQLWESHFHDCYETCIIFKGRLIDFNSNKEAYPAHSLSFKPFEEHYVVAEEDSIFYVEFIRPKVE